MKNLRKEKLENLVYILSIPILTVLNIVVESIF